MTTEPQFRAEILKPRRNVAVLSVEGDVDIYAGPSFKELFLQSIAQGARHVIVDLTRARSVDSTGLGVLVSGAKRAPKGSLSIVCSNEAMANVFALVGLDRIFSMFTTRAAALAAAA
ncbi:MAG TPA: STAS domain-containing protein [Thermoleophilia bacterium]|nr:STAS domain-containing protein [Thermoleophilia bacterium]